MRGRMGHVMWRRAAYWAPAVVAAALLVGGIAAVWTHGLPARAGVGAKQTTATTPGSWARLADTPDPLPVTLLPLPNGKVIDPTLLTYYRAASIYDPSTNTWSRTSSYSSELSGNTAALLADGEILFVGGLQNCPPVQPCYQTTAILYDSNSDTWTTGKTSMQTHRYFAGAVTLHSGKVLVLGGVNADAPIGLNYLTSVELYDPVNDTWTTVAPLSVAREGTTGVVLPDGRVLVVGGLGPATGTTSSTQKPSAPQGCIANCPFPIQAVEIYNPSTNTWSSAGSLPDDRVGYTVTLLPTGKVLIAGGLLGYPQAATPVATNLLYDPATNSWSQAAKMNHQRGEHVASLLATGQVLVAGGVDGANGVSTELYSPASNTWMSGPDLPVYHFNATAVTLQDGRVMVNGGSQGPGCCAYVPATPTFRSLAPRGGGPTIEVDAFSTVPGPPTNVKARAGNNAATVTWSAATPDGSPISGYTVTASPGGKSASVGVTATSATVSGLSGGTSYTFTVAASNHFGSGPSSAPSNAVTPTSPVPTPTPTSPPAAPTATPPPPPAPTATATATPALTTTATPGSGQTVQTSTNNPPPGPPNANRSTGGSPPAVLWLGLLVLVILLLGGGAVFVFARRGNHT